MSDGHMTDINQEVLAVFIEEVVEFLDSLRGETSVVRVRERIEEFEKSSRLVGATSISASASAALAAIAAAKCIDLRVATAVRDFTTEVVWQARQASSLVGVEFAGGAVELKVDGAEKSRWQLW